MNILKAKHYVFSDFGGFYCAFYIRWPADIHTISSLCAGVFKCTKLLDMLLCTSS